MPEEDLLPSAIVFSHERVVGLVLPGNVGVALGIRGDAESLVTPWPAQVGGVDEFAGGRESRHEGIHATSPR